MKQFVMTKPNQKSPYQPRFRRREMRDVNIVFMWIKLVAGAVGLLACLGYFFLGDHRPGGGAGAIPILALIPMAVLGLGLLDLVLLSLSKLADSRMRRHDRHGRSNKWHLIVVTLGGFLFLHLIMVFEFGTGFWTSILASGSSDHGATRLLSVLLPYAAFGGMMLYLWLRPEPAPAALSAEEERVLSDEQRSARKRQLILLGLYVVFVGAAIGTVYVMAYLTS